MSADLANPIPRLMLSRAELAISIGVSPNTLDKMIEEGKLPGPRIWHTRKFWMIAEVLAAIAEWPEAQGGGKKAPEEDADDWRASA